MGEMAINGTAGIPHFAARNYEEDEHNIAGKARRKANV